MNTITKKIPVILMLLIMLSAFTVPVYASAAADPVTASDTSETTSDTGSAIGDKAAAAAIAVGHAAGCGAISMGIAIAKSVEGISRQPEAEGKIRTSLMLGLVFVETAIIYALIVAILIIFVL